MAVAGSLTYETEIDKKGFDKGLSSLKSSTSSAFSQIKNIVAGLGITKLITTAISTITSSVDSAIARVDTLHAYERTMKNLGYSSDEVTESMNKMKKGIEGLPTTLPSVVSMQQQYTALRGSIGEATDLTIALNNATLAGGQGQEVANSAMQQWYQIIANGKPDLQSWKIISSAMPAQLNQIAESCIGSGAKSQDLFEAWKEGTVTTDQVINALIKLDSEGTGSLASFSQQAQDSSGGIDTSMTNIKTAITNGVAEIIEHIGQENITNFLNSIKQLIKDITPVIVDFVDFIIDNIPNIEKGVIVVASFFAAWKTIELMSFIAQSGGLIATFTKITAAIWSCTGAKIADKVETMALTLMYAKDFIVSLASGTAALVKQAAQWVINTGLKVADTVATTAATAATWLFNAALTVLTSPITLVIVAIAALIAIIILVVKKWDIIKEKTLEVAKIMKEKIAELLENITNTLKKWGDNIATFFTETIPQLWQSLLDWFKELPGKIWNWLQNAINNVINFGKDMAQKGKEGALNTFNAIVDKIKEIPGNMLNIGKNIVEGLWNGIKNAGNWIKNKVGEFANGILDGMKNALGIHSPSSLFRDEVGKFIPQGVAVGIEADTDSALKAIDNMNDDIINEMNRAVVMETGSINANASVKSNNSMLNVIQATFNLDSSIEMEGQKVARIITPRVVKNIKAGGVA